MRSSPSARRAPTPRAAAAFALALALVLALVPGLGSGCGHDTVLQCDQSFLRYDNFGALFMANWCNACHSAQLPPDMRQEAPPDVNFDTLDEIRAQSRSIKLTSGDGQTATMPPAGGPSADERAMLVEWLHCGAP